MKNLDLDEVKRDCESVNCPHFCARVMQKLIVVTCDIGSFQIPVEDPVRRAQQTSKKSGYKTVPPAHQSTF